MHGMLFSLCFSRSLSLSLIGVYTRNKKRANRSAQLMTDNLRVFYCSLAQIARREREK